MDANCIELRISSERNMRLIIRMTTAGVMSRAGLTLDESDDMKMAVDEACTLMMMQRPKGIELNITYRYTENNVSVHIATAVCIAGQIIDRTTMEVIRCILEAMADEVKIELDENGCVCSVLLMKRIPEHRGLRS